MQWQWHQCKIGARDSKGITTEEEGSQPLTPFPQEELLAKLQWCESQIFRKQPSKLRAGNH